jgi:hypothetical protein
MVLEKMILLGPLRFQSRAVRFGREFVSLRSGVIVFSVLRVLLASDGLFDAV